MYAKMTAAEMIKHWDTCPGDAEGDSCTTCTFIFEQAHGLRRSDLMEVFEHINKPPKVR